MVCDKYLTSQQNLMKHLLTHNNNHTCTICMKTFKSTHFLKHHMDKHNTSYEYECPVCDKKFKFKNNMRGHLRKHNMEKKFECEVCHKKFIGRYVTTCIYFIGRRSLFSPVKILYGWRLLFRIP